MPFVSKNQERAAFAGGLGPQMKAAAPQWADETDQASLPKKKKTVANATMKAALIKRLMKAAK